MHQRSKHTTGNGYLSCAICDEPLSDHKEIFAHDIPELSLRRMQSSAVPREEPRRPHSLPTCHHGVVCQRCHLGPGVTGISSLTG